MNNISNQDINDLLDLLKSNNIFVNKTNCSLCNSYRICKMVYCKNIFNCNNFINVCKNCFISKKINDLCGCCC